jgi:hypothetical protein
MAFTGFHNPLPELAARLSNRVVSRGNKNTTNRIWKFTSFKDTAIHHRAS